MSPGERGREGGKVSSGLLDGKKEEQKRTESRRNDALNAEVQRVQVVGLDEEEPVRDGANQEEEDEDIETDD